MEAVIHYGALFAIVLIIFLCTAHIIPRIPEGVGMPEKTWIEKLTSFKNPLWSIVAVAGAFTVVLTVLVSSGRQLPATTHYFFIFVFWLATYTFFTVLMWTKSRFVPNEYAASGASIFFIVCLLMYPSWLSADIVAMLSAIAILVVMRGLSLRTASLLGVGIVIYDVIAVFGTKTMLALAQSTKDAPLLIAIPRTLDLSSARYVGLGLGDIIIPGILIMACVVSKNRTMQVCGIVGYFIGLLVAMMVLSLTHAAQPATIYLVPGTLLGICLAAKMEGRLKEAFA